MGQANYDVTINPMRYAIQNLHGCNSRWIESVAIKEKIHGQTVWEGIVDIFDLIDHPAANRCYAWSYKIEGTEKWKYIAVLHQGSVKSPIDAVRAFIANTFKKSNFACAAPD
jgi:hypothetical protein